MLGNRSINRGICILIIGLVFISCQAVRTTYHVTEGTVKATYNLSKFAVKSAYGAGKLIYLVGGFTFEVVSAPLSWPLTHQEIESIDDLPPKEAIRQDKVKRSPYVVNGRRYVPMSMEQARNYRETGVASWYGDETYRQEGGHMTANGEAFNPNGLNAAHKYLPLPTFVKVTNLENRRSIILRVNDRGPFVDGRIIDLSAGAARKLGFYEQGTAKVRVETISAEG
jgi:peptidoglycan lytic transglycosylase